MSPVTTQSTSEALAVADGVVDRLCNVLRLARNTLNAKGGPTAVERDKAVAAITAVFGDLGRAP